MEWTWEAIVRVCLLVFGLLLFFFCSWHRRALPCPVYIYIYTYIINRRIHSIVGTEPSTFGPFPPSPF